MQPVQHSRRPAGPVLGEQHPGQHQIPGLPGVVRLVVRGEAVLLRPALGGGQVALGEQEPRSLRRDGVERAGRARRGLPRFADRLQGLGLVTGRLPIHASVARPPASGAV